MRYLIKIETQHGKVQFGAYNIISASQFIAEAHTNYRNYGMTVGTDYNIKLLTDYGYTDDFDRTEVNKQTILPIRVGIVT